MRVIIQSTVDLFKFSKSEEKGLLNFGLQTGSVKIFCCVTMCLNVYCFTKVYEILIIQNDFIYSCTRSEVNSKLIGLKDFSL